MFLKRLMLPGCLALSLGCSSFSKQECPEECQPPKYPAVGGYSPCCDPKITRKAARQCARDALGDQNYPEEYREGFIQAYMDIAEGASGVTPAVPPEKYWAAWYRTEQGHSLAQVWFEGYEAGVDSARGRGLDRFNRVPTSAPPGMYRDKTNKTSVDPSVGEYPLTSPTWPGQGTEYVPMGQPTPVGPIAPGFPETVAPAEAPLPALPPSQQTLSRGFYPAPAIYPAGYPSQPRVSY